VSKGHETGGRIGPALIVALFIAVSAGGILWFVLGGGAQWLTAQLQALDTIVGRNRNAALALYALGALLLQLFILPAGTLVTLAGGFLFGAPLAAGLYYAAQLTAAPIVYGAARAGFGRYADRTMDSIARRISPERYVALLGMLRKEGVVAVIALRLAPVLTSAMVPLIAATAGIGLARLMLGSLLISWVKPTFTASIGAAARSLAELSEPGPLIDRVSFAPIAAASLAALVLLGVRLMLRARLGRPEQ
jgi:uncharacterized membrane protein YdjX (TVP38/TMEM64 family)